MLSTLSNFRVRGWMCRTESGQKCWRDIRSDQRAIIGQSYEKIAFYAQLVPFQCSVAHLRQALSCVEA